MKKAKKTVTVKQKPVNQLNRLDSKQLMLIKGGAGPTGNSFGLEYFG